MIRQKAITKTPGQPTERTYTDRYQMIWLRPPMKPFSRLTPTIAALSIKNVANDLESRVGADFQERLCKSDFALDS